MGKGLAISALISADEAVFDWLNGLVGKVPVFDRFMRLVVDDWFVLTCLSLSMIIIWFGARSLSQRERNQRAVWTAAWGVGISCLWFHLFRINDIFDRARPLQEGAETLISYMRTDQSFPSEAAAVGFAFATAIWIGNRRAGLALGFLAFLWAFSRVYCGVHYPSDVVAGALIGIFTSFLMYFIWRILKFAPNSFIKLMQWIHLA